MAVHMFALGDEGGRNTDSLAIFDHRSARTDRGDGNLMSRRDIRSGYRTAADLVAGRDIGYGHGDTIAGRKKNSVQFPILVSRPPSMTAAAANPCKTRRRQAKSRP